MAQKVVSDQMAMAGRHRGIIYWSHRGKERVSSGGGTKVRWCRDGRELYLYYVTRVVDRGHGAFISGHRSTVPFGPGRALSRAYVAGVTSIARQQYVPSADGQTFLVRTVEGTAAPAPITLVLNWRGFGDGR